MTGAHGETDGAILVLPEETSEQLSTLASHGYPFVVVDPLRELAMGIPVVSSANSSGATRRPVTCWTSGTEDRCDQRPGRLDGE